MAQKKTKKSVFTPCILIAISVGIVFLILCAHTEKNLCAALRVRLNSQNKSFAKQIEADADSSHDKNDESEDNQQNGVVVADEKKGYMYRSQQEIHLHKDAGSNQLIGSKKTIEQELNMTPEGNWKTVKDVKDERQIRAPTDKVHTDAKMDETTPDTEEPLASAFQIQEDKDTQEATENSSNKYPEYEK